VVEIRAIGARDLEKIWQIDSSDESEAIYLQRGTELELVPRHHHAMRQTASSWAGEIGLWIGFVNDGGSAFGAFEDEKLVGFSVLKARLTPEVTQLAGLYVDRGSRGAGVGRALVERSVTVAKESGAESVYVSATRAQATVAFYLGLGFLPVPVPNLHLYELEPFDIHMSLDLGDVPS
jgi:GNAT superfamily N-acetyltransferase